MVMQFGIDEKFDTADTHINVSFYNYNLCALLTISYMQYKCELRHNRNNVTT